MGVSERYMDLLFSYIDGVIFKYFLSYRILLKVIYMQKRLEFEKK